MTWLNKLPFVPVYGLRPMNTHPDMMTLLSLATPMMGDVLNLETGVLQELLMLKVSALIEDAGAMEADVVKALDRLQLTDGVCWALREQAQPLRAVLVWNPLIGSVLSNLNMETPTQAILKEIEAENQTLEMWLESLPALTFGVAA